MGNKVAVLSSPRGVWLPALASTVARARGTLFPWAPLLVGTGVGLWFSLPFEPGTTSYVIAVCLAAAAAMGWRLGPELSHPFAVVILCLSLGWLACGLRLWSVDAPILGFRYYGAVTGRVVDIDRSQTDALRVTLDRVWLDRVDPDRTPDKVRISLRGREPGHVPAPGEIIMVTAHLAPPEGPTEPGAFDFRQMAYFEGLGALGYATAPVMLWRLPETGARPIDRLRNHLSGAMMRAMPGQAGAFAAGAMTGDRSGITQDTVRALRDSSLAHLLAISGMNLAFLIAFVFGLIRYGMALVPVVALRVNSKKVAAVVSLGVAAFYLALSGSNVATERAFVMVTVMLGAVLLDRKALTLRSVAIAGLLLLLWKPESLMEPGFQMSFAATVALIAGFREVDRRIVAGRMPRWAMPIFTLILSSVIGGLATAPYAAAHFNRFTDYGLIANLLTVPVMGVVVMPAGAVAALLAPFGLAALPLWAMERGAAWILMVAHWIAGWEGSVTPIPAPGGAVLPLVTFSGALLVLVPGWWRAAAAGPAVLALALWSFEERPMALISADASLVGVMAPGGRALSAPKGAGFSARAWLENDGDLADQATAAQRPGFSGEDGRRRFSIGALRGIALKGRGTGEAVLAACAEADFVVAATEVPAPPTGCLVLDRLALKASGAIALWPDGDGARIVAANAKTRAWTRTRAFDLPVRIIPRADRLAAQAIKSADQ